MSISVSLQTLLAAESHTAEGQWLKEQLKGEKRRKFLAGTRILIALIQFNSLLFVCRVNIYNNNNNKLSGPYHDRVEELAIT
jgi:hypothetical protein